MQEQHFILNSVLMSYEITLNSQQDTILLSSTYGTITVADIDPVRTARNSTSCCSSIAMNNEAQCNRMSQGGEDSVLQAHDTPEDDAPTMQRNDLTASPLENTVLSSDAQSEKKEALLSPSDYQMVASKLDTIDIQKLRALMKSASEASKSKQEAPSSSSAPRSPLDSLTDLFVDIQAAKLLGWLD